MTGIKDYSTTALTNTEVGGVNIEEGMLPSTLNNALRAILVDVREWYNDSQWVVYGDGDSAFTITYGSATTFTVDGVDVTTFYHVGRSVRAVGSTTGTIYGTIIGDVRVDDLTIAVIDQGLGIAPKDHERIFERFYRVDRARSRSTGGTGLGLSIVRHVVDSHGGKIEVKSNEGEGATFTVVLPRQKD